MTHYRRGTTDLRDDLAAIAAGAAVGAGVAYLVRLIRQRAPLDRRDDRSREEDDAGS